MPKRLKKAQQININMDKVNYKQQIKNLWSLVGEQQGSVKILIELEKFIKEKKKEAEAITKKAFNDIDELYEKEESQKELLQKQKMQISQEQDFHEFVRKAAEYAILCHEQTNHTYDGWPYSLHLESVYEYALKYRHLIPKEDINDVLAACWCHDTIEDTRQTYNDVKKVTNTAVADIVYAVTNNKGKTRTERADATYYNEIKLQPYATFVKLCDRLANIEYSKRKESRMFEVYKNEHHHFVLMTYDIKYDEMFAEMESLLNLTNEQK